MGHVYRAWDARLHREVAVKLLNHEYAMPGMRERFLREARAASALNHPNICTIFDIGEQDGDPYLVMELLQGETLKDRILSRTMQVDEIVAVARETAEALGAAHSKGVVHRDVKPANIFLVDKPNGGIQAKVLDFGLAKIEGGVLGARGRSLELTTAGATVGTLAYMSPEQARGEALDSRSDLFSLGVVMYEMATRQVPFQGATSALVFVQLLNHAPEPVREWNESVPRELEKIIFKLLAKERTARFQTARELELALIAIGEKGSGGGGGWLRKAVASATVPLVRAPDPVAREKRLPKSKPSSAGSDFGGVRPVTPMPAAGASNDSPRPADDQFLRPVARVPRGDTTPNPGRSGQVADMGVASMFTPVPRSTLSRRAGDPPSQPQVAPASTVAPAPSEDLEVKPISEVRSVVEALPVEAPIVATVVTEPLVEHEVSAPVDEVILEPVADPSASEIFPPLLEVPAAPKPKRLPFQPLWLGIGALIVVVVAVLLYLYLNRASFGAAALKKTDAVVVTEIENRTGDKSLDGSIAEGLAIDLAQSPWLLLRDQGAYRAARHGVLQIANDAMQNNGVLIARRTADRLGAKAYLYGSLSGSGAPYTLHVDLHDVATNDVLASAEERVDSLQQVAGAIDSVAGELRLACGEPRGSIDERSTGLSHEATGNLAALQLLWQAQVLIASHEAVAGLADLQQAVALEPKFTQAHLELAHLYAQLHAETAAADAARAALAGSDSASQRTRILAQAAYEMETSGDLLRATAVLRQLIFIYPHDSDALAALAETLLLEGRMSEALQAAQQSYAADPYYAASYAVAQAALLGMDRYDSAYQLNAQAQRLGLAGAGESFAVAYLDRRNDVVEELAGNIPVGKIEYRPDREYGLYLDSSGRFSAGSTLWFSRAEAAQENDSLKSAATFLLAQGALDRALLNECGAAGPFFREAEAVGVPVGRVALFNLGMAHAICGDTARATEISGELLQRFPQSFAVNAFGLADLRAAIALAGHDAASAIELLKTARAYDLISLTAYLRGEAHSELRQYEVGIVDFQTVLSHRGASFVAGSDVYPGAQIGVARAFAASGDLNNSGEAYRRFVELWPEADTGSQLMVEAHQHAMR